MSDWDPGGRAGGQFDAARPSWPDGTTYPFPLPFPLPQAVDAEDGDWPADVPRSPGGGGPPGDRGRPPSGRHRAQAGAPPRGEAPPLDEAPPPGWSYYPWPPAPYPARLRDAAVDPGDWTASDGRGPGGRRWLLPGGIAAAAAAVGAAAVLLTGGHPAARGGLAAPSATASAAPRATPSAAASMAVRMAAKPSASRSQPPAAAPLTLAQAAAVLASYTTANNSANAQRSGASLATIEAGSSFAIDAGLYKEQQAAGAGPYPPFSPVQATYYVPRDNPAGGPRWFVVQVANAFTANPGKVTTREYLLFTQSAAGGGWQDVIEPYLLSGAGAPQVAVGADGLASAVTPGSGSVTVAPGQLPAVTAASLDGSGDGAVADPGNLADRADQRNWAASVQGGLVVDAHAAAAGASGQEFALRTADGGALVFYTDAAQVTVAAPPGSALHLSIPGFRSSSQGTSPVQVSYLEQFAAYDPPAGGGTTARVVADFSGITGAG